MPAAEAGRSRPGRPQAAGPPLPAAAELSRLYEVLRARYFRDGGRALIPPAGEVRIEWSNRLTASAGKCWPAERLIRLSTHYHRAHPDEVAATLTHEMIHLLVPNHGPNFRAWLARIRAAGGRVERYAAERATPAGPTRWLYRCRHCAHEYPRRRRLPRGGRRHRCGRCRGELQETALA